MKKFVVSCVGFSILFIMPTLVQAADMHHLRNQRYCEVLVAQTLPEGGLLKLNVYNTLGLNDCPQEVWNRVSVEDVKKSTQAAVVVLNGPRYFVIDGMRNTEALSQSPVQFDGLSARLAGILTISVADYQRAEPYHPRSVHRHTTWVYLAQRPIYELVDPVGTRYVMQSYSVQKINQSLRDLDNLGNRLMLPKGWSFSTKVLKKKSELTAINQQTQVIQDDFSNTYQIETEAFMKDAQQ